jgi:hypothetical protein
MQAERISSAPKTKVSRSKRDKYHRISLKTKLIFYHKVIHQQANLIEVHLPSIQITQRLGIKYSTAKTLLRNYKRLPEESDERLVRSLLE